jgi:hypothetical protein
MLPDVKFIEFKFLVCREETLVSRAEAAMAERALKYMSLLASFHTLTDSWPTA